MHDIESTNCWDCHNLCWASWRTRRRNPASKRSFIVFTPHFSTSTLNLVCPVSIDFMSYVIMSPVITVVMWQMCEAIFALSLSVNQSINLIRHNSSLAVFERWLKTYLFTQSFYWLLPSHFVIVWDRVSVILRLLYSALEVTLHLMTLK